MKSVKKILLFIALGAVILTASTFSSGVLAYEQTIASVFSSPVSASNPATPIQHIIFVINENHPFDNMFGTFPGIPAAYALNLTSCMPFKSGQTTQQPCQKPYSADNLPAIQATDQCHTWNCAVAAYNNGKMNGFYQVDTNRTMAYYDGGALPQTWDLASYFDLNYNFFSSALSYSESNHLYSVAAASPKTEVTQSIAPLNLTYPEIGTAMTNAGVTWGYFQYNWNDAKDCTGNYNSQSGLFKGGGDGYWEGEVQFRAVQNTAIECSSLGNINDFLKGLTTNTLPQVSFVIPEPSESAHPGQSTWAASEQFTSSIINDIEQSAVWSHSVTYVTWDDYGGYYDGVVPNQLDQFGNGFRVPLIAVSPFSISGSLIGGCPGAPAGGCSPRYSYYNNFTTFHGNTTQDDFSSFLSTIEYNWGVHPIALRDAEEPNLFYMLNFNQTPLAPLYFNSNYALAAYPLSACMIKGGCQIGAPFSPHLPLLSSICSCVSIASGGSLAYSVYNATAPAWTESPQQSAAYAGDGDPGD